MCNPGWRVGLQGSFDLARSERFRFYALGRAFFEERHVETPSMTLLEQEGWGAGFGLGLAARLTPYAEVFGEYVIERASFDGEGETGATAMLGLRFRN